jgi:hypothetical protein
MSQNLTMEQMVQALQSPFPSERVGWKPQATKGDRALAVPFIDARDVAERLDQAVGPFNWQADHKIVGEQLLSGIAIRHPETGEWVWKWDGGLVVAEARRGQGGGKEEISADERIKAAKGTLSDGFKRAAVLWGVFRYAYRLPKEWVPFDPEARRLRQVPTLPAWALPEDERSAPAAGGSKPHSRGGDARSAEGGNGKRTGAGQGSGAATSEAPADYLRVTVPFGSKGHPEFRGQPLGDLLRTEDGRRFVEYLAKSHQPKSAAHTALVQAARALLAAGLAQR